jgi:hypothetical protein
MLKMPYKISSDNLPSYVKKLNDKLKSKWVNIFNAAYEKYGEEKAFIIANTWLKSIISSKKTIAQTEKTLSVIKFELDNSKELIKRSEAGDEYIDFVLTDTLPDKEGIQYPLSLLEKWAKQINEGDMLLGDTDHEEYDRLVATGISPDEVIEGLKKKTGIAKALKAVINKGKLWVRAIIDKRYKTLIKDKAKGVSLEAVLVRDANSNIVDGDLGGFTFGVNCNPVNERAVIA